MTSLEMTLTSAGDRQTGQNPQGLPGIRPLDRLRPLWAGASFAGLAGASRLRWNILLIDKNEIGSGQTSAGGTLLNVPELLDSTDSILQI